MEPYTTTIHIDKGEEELRATSLTEENVNPDKIPKMKVAACIKVFSWKVASTLNMVAKRCKFFTLYNK